MAAVLLEQSRHSGDEFAMLQAQKRKADSRSQARSVRSKNLIGKH